MRKIFFSAGPLVVALILFGPGSLGSGAQTAGSVALAAGTPLNAELTSSLDSKKAKAGDPVNARVSEAVKAEGEVVIPKGAKLVGHLTQVSARAKGNADSSLAIQFDKAVLKNGQEVPVALWIRAMAAEPRNNFQAGPPQDLTAGTPGGGPSLMSGRAPGATGTPAPGIPAEAGSSGKDSRNARDIDDRGGGLNAAGQLSPNSSGVYGIDGVHLAADASNATQGSLITCSGKAMHLDSGTRLLLIVQTEAPSTSSK